MTFKEYIAQIKQPRAQAILAASIPTAAVCLCLMAKFPAPLNGDEKNLLITMFLTILFGWAWIAPSYLLIKAAYHLIRLDIRNCAYSSGLFLSATLPAALIVDICS